MGPVQEAELSIRAVRYTPQAVEAIEHAIDWWRANRDKAHDALEEELARSLRLIAASPVAGSPARSTALHGVRRVLLGRVRYHLYYRWNDETDEVEVLDLWHASRRTGPEL